MAGIIKVNQYQDFNGNSIMTSDGSGNLTTQKINYPGFEVNLQSQTFNVANNTDTKVIMTNEVADTNSAYDTSTGRFTPQVAGKYFCYARISFDNTSDFDNIVCNVKKKWHSIRTKLWKKLFHNTLPAYGIASFNGSSDYLELFCIQVSGGTIGLLDSGNGGTTMFGAYRIGS